MEKTEKKKALRERIVILALIGILVIAIIGGSSMAQVTKRAETENIISSGEITVKLLNKMKNGDDMPELITHIVPGDTLDNVVSVKNTCQYDEYIRISLDKVIYETAEENAILDDSKATFLLNEEDWTYNEKDGYYYYNEVLKAGETSEALYDGIFLSYSMGNEYKLAVMDVEITVEAVQSVNNGDVFTAEGWTRVARSGSTVEEKTTVAEEIIVEEAE